MGSMSPYIAYMDPMGMVHLNHRTCDPSDRRPIPYVSSHGQNGRAKTVTMRRLNFFDRHVVKQDM